MEIKGNTFLVTGGASGLGGAVVDYLIENGGNAAILDLRATEDTNPAALFCQCDVTDEVSVAAAIDTAHEAYGAISGLVQCAGIAVGEKVVGSEGPHRLGSFSKCIEVNLIGTFNVARLVAESMAKNQGADGAERGVIVNTASIAAFDGQVGQAAYAASKAGVAGMTLPMARELASHGIRVMTVSPGLFLTPMLAGLPAKVQDSLASQPEFPKRLGAPAEFAQLVASIIENPMLNAEVIRLDAGLRMAAK